MTVESLSEGLPLATSGASNRLYVWVPHPRPAGSAHAHPQGWGKASVRNEKSRPMPKEERKSDNAPKRGTAAPAKPGSSSELIVRDIVMGLYEGRFVPGQRLVEPDLVAHYGVSRGTVREALKQLSSEGVVITLPFRGAQIRRLTRAEAANLFAITEVILGLAARQAALNPDPEARKQIDSPLAAIRAFREDEGSYEFMRHRNRFFRALVAIAGNDEIMRILPRLQVHLIRNRLSVPPTERIAGYQAIAQAVRQGDDGAAEAAARRYVAKTAACTLPSFPD